MYNDYRLSFTPVKPMDPDDPMLYLQKDDTNIHQKRSKFKSGVHHDQNTKYVPIVLRKKKKKGKIHFHKYINFY